MQPYGAFPTEGAGRFRCAKLRHVSRFWTTAKALLIEENVGQRFAGLLGRPTLLILVHCAPPSFFLDLFEGYTVSGCYEVLMLM